MFKKFLKIFLLICLLTNFNILTAYAGESFFVASAYDVKNRQEIEAKLLLESDRAYFYIEEAYFNDLDTRDQQTVKDIFSSLSEIFDNEIYPKTTALFGDVWNPGIDKDPKITILFTTMIEQAGGYFRSEDEAGLENNSLSNEREMIYLNVSYLQDHRLKGYLAHELQHLITYNQKERIQEKEEDVWLNELRSEYIATYLGYDKENYQASNLKRRVDKFLQYPSDSLTEWQSRIYDYPSINLFAQYLADHYGDNFFRHMIASDKTGIASINDAFKQLKINQTFSNAFGNWLVALYLNDTTEDIHYGYVNPLLKTLKVTPTAKYNVLGNATLTRSGLMKEWTPFWYEINTQGNDDNKVTISFKGDTPRGFFKAKVLKIDSRGDRIISDWDIGNQESKLTIEHLGQGLQKIVLMPYLVNIGNYTNGNLNYVNFDFTFKATKEDNNQIDDEGEVNLLDPQVTRFSDLKDGDLVRAQGDFKVYIIQGNYKRHIQSAQIFNFYKHLNWENVQEISPYELSLYIESKLIRTANKDKVYMLDEQNLKHWYNVSGYEFVNAGNDWSSVYVINQQEASFYKTGESVSHL
jgi:hypothetical protein